MRLEWRSGKFCGRECYYFTAATKSGTYTISRARTNGEWRHMVWFDKDFLAIFVTREAAEMFARLDAEERC